MEAVVQLIVLVVAEEASYKLTLAAHKVKPGLGAVEIDVDHPDGGLNEPVAHV
jgi:hypothetical protein